MIGQTISHYKILSKLGEGGMGVVYKAQDLKLQRPVALKFLPSNLLGNEEAKARFLREARAAAALQHPNICTVYEIDEADGQTFIAMACLEGDELTKSIDKGPLSVERLLEIAIQIARGLQEAHGKGVVHRDIKPANIMDNTSGQAVLMDFGLAQLASAASKLTREGTTVGTSAYMSPEQTTGEKIDHRTDVWALGVVLYEMATGQVPFQGHYEQAILYSILNEEPQPLTGVRTGLPAGLERLVNKCLSKRAGERYQTVSDLLADLSALKRATESGGGRRPSSGANDTQPSIAVLPFVNRNRDEESEYFSDGLTDELIAALAQVEGLHVAGRASAFQFKGKAGNLEEIGRNLRVSYVVDGTVRRAGQRVRVTAQLVNVADGYQIWSQTFDRVIEDIFDVQEEIAQGIVRSLKGKLVHARSEPIVKQTTENPKAYDLYLRGMYHLHNRYDRQGFETAIDHFERACGLDPSFADASAALASALTSFATIGWVAPKDAVSRARSEVMRVIEMNDEIPAAHTALGKILSLYDWDWTGAEREYRRAIELNPSDAAAHYGYSFYLTHRGRSEEAIAEVQTTLRLDPLWSLAQSHLAMALFFARRYGECIEQCEKVLDLYPEHIVTHWYLGLARSCNGDLEGGIDTLERGLAIDPSNPVMKGLLGWSASGAGRTNRGEQLLDECLKRRKEGYFSAFCVALIYLGLGNLDAAWEWLHEAVDDRDGLLAWIEVWPLLDPLRSDPRFHKVLERMNLR